MSNIPKQDLVNALPIRWAFSIFCNSSSNSKHWRFPAWRDYLLEPTDKSIGKISLDLRHILYGGGLDKTFPQRTRHFLAHNKADTLIGFLHYWAKCCRNYEEALRKHSIIP